MLHLHTQTVNQIPTTTTLSSSANPSTSGQSVTLTATVSPSTATGTVQFAIDGTNVGSPVTLSSGQATFSSSSLSVGSHTITVAYSGDTNDATSASPTLSQTVNQIPTTTTLSSSANPSTSGQSVTLTATVSPSTATGTVTFAVDGTTQLGSPVTLSSGQATFSSSSLSVGSHTITVAYSGDTNDATSASPTLSQTVNQIPTTTTLSSSANPSTSGQSVTLTATVSPSTATGTVTFTVDGTAQPAVTLSGGQATFSSSSLSVGSHTITAAYSGDTNDATSASSTLSQTVNQIPTTTTLSSSANPSTSGQSVTLTATVSPSTATGTVTFTVDGTAQPAVTLSGGQATFSSSSLSVGSHTITAAYSGDTNDATSASSTLTQTVNQLTTTMLSSSNNPSTSGQSVTLTATVSPSTATGAVQFAIDGTNVGSPVTLSGGQATFSSSSLSVGSHTITAAYSGDTNIIGSTTTMTQTVNQIPTTTTLSSSANPSTSGQSVTLTATVSPSTATGAVQFAIDGTNVGSPVTLSGGQATFSSSSLSVGSHTITAAYSGDTNDATSASSTLSQTVNQIPTTTTLSSSANPSTSGQSVTLTATVSPSTATGTVQFAIDGTNVGSPVTLSGGQATFHSSSLSVGSHTITAAYSGDTNDATSASPALSQTVNKGSVAILLSSSVSSDTFGQPVTLTAIVSPVAPATSLPGGYVQFISNSQDLGSPVPLSNDKATLVITSLPAGTNYIVVSYFGNSNFVPGNSNSVIVKITLTYLQQKTGVITSLTGLVQSDRDDKNNIDAAIKQVTESIKPSLWQADGLHLNTKNGEQVFDAEKHAVNQLMDMVRHHKESQAFDSTIEKNINTLVSVDQGISSTAISDVSSGIPHGDSVKDLAQAQKEIVMAAGETSVGHFDAAIDHYKNAWKQAQEVLLDQTATVHH